MEHFTSYGKQHLLDAYHRVVNRSARIDSFRDDVIGSFKMVLCSSVIQPSEETKHLRELSEVESEAGSGYTQGGRAVTADVVNRSNVYIFFDPIKWHVVYSRIVDVRYAVLVDERQNVIAYWDLGSNRDLTPKETFTLEHVDLILRKGI